MEISLFVVLIFVFIPLIWFLITGVIMMSTGRDISITDIIDYFISKKHYLANRDIYENILRNKFKYYSDLPTGLKEKFLKRVSYFISSKEFKVLPDEEATTEEKVLISAAAIQVTFGLNKYLLEHFSKIFIYKKEYYSKLDKHFHLGEVNMQGAIVLSLEDFFHGYENPTDGINVGIHEMAHALSLELMLKDEYEEFFATYFVKWQQAAETEFLSMRRRRESFLREYAKTNMVEFFAVCAENFFERAQEFRNKLPELYERMTILLNQDPTQNFIIGNSPRIKFSNKINVLLIPKNLLYKSKVSFQKITDPIIITIVIVLVITYFTGNFYISLFITAPSFIIYLSYTVFAKAFFIYDNCLVIHNRINMNSEGEIFEFEKIIFVSKPDEKSVGITYIYNGKIHLKQYAWLSGDKELTEFFKALRQQKIMVKASNEY